MHFGHNHPSSSNSSHVHSHLLTHPTFKNICENPYSPVCVAQIILNVGASTGVCLAYRGYIAKENWLSRSLSKQLSNDINSLARDGSVPTSPLHGWILSGLILHNFVHAVSDVTSLYVHLLYCI